MKAYTKDILYLEFNLEEVKNLHKELLSIEKNTNASVIPVLADMLKSFINCVNQGQTLNS